MSRTSFTPADPIDIQESLFDALPRLDQKSERDARRSPSGVSTMSGLHTGPATSSMDDLDSRHSRHDGHSQTADPMEGKPSWSLQVKLALISAPLILLLTLLSTGLYLGLHTKEAVQRQQSEQQLQAQAIALWLASPLASNDTPGIEQVLQRAMVVGGHSDLQVEGLDGKVLASRHRSVTSGTFSGSDRIVTKVDVRPPTSSDAPDPLSRLGSLTISASKPSIMDAIRQEGLWLAMAMVTFLTGMALCLPWVFRRMVLKPLEVMLISFQAIEANQAPQTVEILSNDELGALANTYNRVQGLLASKSRRLEQLYHRTPALLFTLDAQGRFASVSNFFSAAIGHARARLTEHSLTELVAVDSMESYRHHVARELALGMSLSSVPLTLNHADGRLLQMLISTMPERDSNGRVIGNLCVMTDVTKQMQDQELITRQANFDPVTLLPNRYLLRDRIQLSAHDARRAGTKMGILFLDLDRFKNVNDSMGHAVGDQLLKSVAQRLQASLRAGDTASRFGGDEFVVVVTNIQHAAEVEAMGRRILATLNTPYDVDGRPLYTGASIGIAMFPENGDDPDTLLKNADAAMYRAKEAGRNNLRFFTSGMNERTRRWMHIESSLRHALGNDGFELAYQPVIRLHDERLVGYEALIRMRGLDGATISPAEFIPVAEESGLVQRLGDWVLHEAIQVLAASDGDEDIYIAVNVSPRQLRDTHLPSRIEAMLAEHGVDPKRLTLELTESSLIDAQSGDGSIVHALAAIGCPLAMDDFGTGYSSLGYLKRFPFTTLKIDRSFIDGLPHDREDCELVDAVLAIAKTFALDVVAEGVETAEQAAYLRLAGCNKVQGYYYGKPETGSVWNRTAFQAFTESLGPASQ